MTPSEPAAVFFLKSVQELSDDCQRSSMFIPQKEGSFAWGACYTEIHMEFRAVIENMARLRAS